MQARELRQAYLEFFESKGALRLPSDSLVTDDPTLLFTVAGMVPFKAYFEDRATPPRRSVATSQKCLRTKDIDDIGDTSHCTFFEMLGNFSFGDYFKKEAIAWSWEFLFDVLKLDPARIRVTIYEEDDDAYTLWRAAGMPHERIARLGQKTNYWPANAIAEQSQGPCGPCSEIFFDLQPHLPFDQDWDGEGSRWLEIWNNVFTQYTGRGTGADYQLIELPKKNIDTGMGLERTAAAINDLAGPFETDVLRPIIAHLETLSGKTYTATPDTATDIAFRRIADHVRATTFLIADGVVPGPSAQGYVLRRLMRRAIVAGIRHLGFENQELLEPAIPGVVENMKDAYPELETRLSTILSLARQEEAQFRQTLRGGLARLDDALEAGSLSGTDAFDLFSTYGLPFEVTREVAQERGVTVSEDEFRAAEIQHAIDSGKGNKKTWVLTDERTKELLRSLPPTQFVGYDQLTATATVLGILIDGVPVQHLGQGQEAELVLDTTPLYAESGGQVGDTGAISGPGGVFAVLDTQKREGIWFHRGVLPSGSLAVGATVTAAANGPHRLPVRRNHTATHLLHKALRTRLGVHVAQRGSYVGPGHLRFDFSHNVALTDAELADIEAEVNAAILEDLAVDTLETSQNDARQRGAMMLFGEKYGDLVRMVCVGGDFSIELCGGTHVDRTGQIGLFRILSEGSAAAGVRRIEAVTGAAANAYDSEQIARLKAVSDLLGTRPASVAETAERLLAQVKELQHEVKTLKAAQAGGLADTLLTDASLQGTLKLLVTAVETDEIGALADELIGKIGSGVVVLGTAVGGKALFVAKATRDAVGQGVHCGNLVKAAAQTAGGGGGGRPDFAQAGGKEVAKLSDALAAARAALDAQLGG
jgi:alanyl-tRNA synthetase